METKTPVELLVELEQRQDAVLVKLGELNRRIEEALSRQGISILADGRPEVTPQADAA